MSMECESARDGQLVISEQNTDTYVTTAHLWEGDRCAESNPDNLSPQSTASPATLLPHCEQVTGHNTLVCRRKLSWPDSNPPNAFSFGGLAVSAAFPI